PFYDRLGRVRFSCAASSACRETQYAGLVTDSFDEKRDHTRQTMNAAGHIVETAIFPHNAAVTTRFEYGAFETLIRITDAQGNVVTQTFDRLGRRSSLIDRDIGRLDNDYNAFGEVTAQVDA